ncbi:uncharacterized protein N0V89_011742 [Didymosphaeria variabile]|uniref:Uncharacterized protein n=1 Tax=Didymosphaeria variabile TaxID=1932322 RepID=A0A9W8XAS1_9PLEO|nr:uncharacterized protein N0V89_011742 [Didymosphaeria variabile]KAJ4345609.1 hypothetical protein N0V89_011742 [Didymosphaeria variabile]
MKTWLHTHGLRRQHSDAALPNRKFNPSDTNNAQHAPLLPNRKLTDTAAKVAASKTASRMSIERYLQAPLEDEPASVPAINAALKEKSPPVWSDRNHPQAGHRRGHSRGTSYDANSEGRRTFYTSASGQDSTGTSFSIGLRSNHNQRSNAHPMMPQLPRLRTVALMHDNVHSPDEPTTGRTLDSERTLTDQNDGSPPGKSVDSAYRARIEAELARIQQKARRLEEEVRRFNEQKENEALLVPRITDDMAYQQMASKPKLAWILGGDSANARTSERPTTSARGTAEAFNDSPNRPATSAGPIEEVQDRLPRRSKSSSVLVEEARRSSNRRRAVVVGQTPSNGKVQGTILKEHVSTHNFRNCNQRLYFSAQQFRQHLQDNHKINFDGTLFAGWTLLLKSSKQDRTAVFEVVDVSPRRAYTDPVVAAPKQQGKKAKEVAEPKMNFMDFSETPQFAPKKKIRRKASTQTMPDALIKGVRDSTIEFTRAATMDHAHGGVAQASRSARADKSTHAVASHAISAGTLGLEFFRRRLDGSARNRLYVRDESEGPLSKNSQKLFRKVPGSAFGGLILHSSLLAATPARLTNSVDIYTLH